MTIRYRLGPKQLDQLASLGGVFSAVIVPDKMTNSLVARGLMVSLAVGNGGFLAITPAGYRAIADALESGSLVRPPIKDWVKP